jgi:hypothetical protein
VHATCTCCADLCHAQLRTIKHHAMPRWDGRMRCDGASCLMMTGGGAHSTYKVPRYHKRQSSPFNRHRGQGHARERDGRPPSGGADPASSRFPRVGAGGWTRSLHDFIARLHFMPWRLELAPRLLLLLHPDSRCVAVPSRNETKRKLKRQNGSGARQPTPAGRTSRLSLAQNTTSREPDALCTTRTCHRPHPPA